MSIEWTKYESNINFHKINKKMNQNINQWIDVGINDYSNDFKIQKDVYTIRDKFKKFNKLKSMPCTS